MRHVHPMPCLLRAARNGVPKTSRKPNTATCGERNECAQSLLALIWGPSVYFFQYKKVAREMDSNNIKLWTNRGPASEPFFFSFVLVPDLGFQSQFAHAALFS